MMTLLEFTHLSHDTAECGIVIAIDENTGMIKTGYYKEIS